MTRRFQRGFTLGVSLDGRMEYSKHLRVFGQRRTGMTVRQAVLLERFTVCFTVALSYVCFGVAVLIHY